METSEDDCLQKAVEESCRTSSVMPILKRELWYKIQHKRLSEGHDELEVEFDNPKEQKLTDDDIWRRNKRRSGNRQSALRSRHRLRSLEKQYQEEIFNLEELNQNLQLEINQLSKEVDELRTVINHHICKKHRKDIYTERRCKKKFISLLTKQVIEIST